MGNKGVKNSLYRIYGKQCMFLTAGIPDIVEKLNIKGYRQYKSEQKYTRKKLRILEQTLTYHH